MKKVLIATPCYGDMVCTGYFLSILNMVAHLSSPEIQFQIYTIGNESLITRARNTCVAYFLASDFTHLLFIDADIQFDHTLVKRLLDFDRDVVCASYPRKGIMWDKIKTLKNVENMSLEEIQSKMLSFNLNITTKPGQQTRDVVNGFIQVDQAATGFMCIKREVFDRLREAYPEQQYQSNAVSEEMKPHMWLFFDCMVDENKTYLSEDFAFCNKFRKIGGEVWMDIMSPLTHTGTYKFSGNIRYMFTGN
jgi:glycosyltransferase involved in cell wall biosynthesis